MVSDTSPSSRRQREDGQGVELGHIFFRTERIV